HCWACSCRAFIRRDRGNSWGGDKDRTVARPRRACTYRVRDVGDPAVTLQIDRLLLYSTSGQIRRLQFRKGTVNVITGASGTGKSSIISIVEYCLGRSEFGVPEGEISDNVSWYGVVYALGKQQVLVAKPKPREDKQSQSEVYFETASRIQDPRF